MEKTHFYFFFVYLGGKMIALFLSGWNSVLFGWKKHYPVLIGETVSVQILPIDCAGTDFRRLAGKTCKISEHK